MADKVRGGEEHLIADGTLLSNFMRLPVEDWRLLQDFFIGLQAPLFLLYFCPHLVDEQLVLLDFILQLLCSFKLVLILSVNLRADSLHILLLVEQVLCRDLAKLE